MLNVAVLLPVRQKHSSDSSEKERATTLALSPAVSQYHVCELQTHGLGSSHLAIPDIQVHTSEDGSTHLQLEQQRIR